VRERERERASEGERENVLCIACLSLMVSTHCTNACKLSAFCNSLCVFVCVCVICV